jgi:hypothetical protein
MRILRTVIRITANGDTPEATSVVARFLNEPVFNLVLFLRAYYKAVTSKTIILNEVFRLLAKPCPLKV